jgi:iron complex transport system substrate-binding protein
VTERSLRVCSLLPSATEIVAGLGCIDLLVGRSAECNYPAEVSRLPVVTAARIETGDLTSLQIDDAVRAAVLEGRSLYAIDEALIRSLHPDLIITQDLCHVCAVSSDDVRELASLDVEMIAGARAEPRPDRAGSVRIRRQARGVRGSTASRRAGLQNRGCRW